MISTDAYSTTTGNVRVGPRMWQAYNFVRCNPDCSKYAASKAIGPNGSRFYGWRALQRAIHAGLILAVQTDRGTFKLRAVPVKSLFL